MADTLADRLMELLRTSRLAEIDYEDGDVRIHLVRDEPQAAPAPAESAAKPKAEPATHAVVAGLTGTFYRAPSPDRPPYVAVGNHVAEGDIIALLEAMKMLNPVEADRAGRIVAIEADDGALVSRGSVLVRIAKEEP